MVTVPASTRHCSKTWNSLCNGESSVNYSYTCTDVADMHPHIPTHTHVHRHIHVYIRVHIRIRIHIPMPIVIPIRTAPPRMNRVGFVGPNGSGKSTLLKLVMGLEDPLHGFTEFGSQSVEPA